jgi:hypothetical protein
LRLWANAFEFEETFERDGKRLRRRFSVGGIVVWALVFLVLGLAGKSLPALLPRLLLK